MTNLRIKYHGAVNEPQNVFYHDWYCGWWGVIELFIKVVKFLWLLIVTIKIIREPP